MARRDGGASDESGQDSLDQLALWARVSAVLALALILLSWFLPWASAETSIGAERALRTYWPWGVTESALGDTSAVESSWTAWVGPAVPVDGPLELIQAGTILFAAATALVALLLVEDTRGRRRRARHLGPIAATVAVLGGSLILATLALSSGGEGFGLGIGVFVVAGGIILATMSGAASQALAMTDTQRSERPIDEWLFAQETLYARPSVVQRSTREAARPAPSQRARRAAFRLPTLGARPGPVYYFALILLVGSMALPWASGDDAATNEATGEVMVRISFDIYFWGLRALVYDAAPGLSIDDPQETWWWFSPGMEAGWEGTLVRLGFVLFSAGIATGAVAAVQGLRGLGEPARKANTMAGLLVAAGAVLLLVPLTSGLGEAERFVIGAAPFLALVSAILIIAPSRAPLNNDISHAPDATPSS